MIKENSKAPNFNLPSSANNNFEINKSLKQYLVIYFYPRDNTPGCTNEAKDFSKLYKEFKKLNCEIVGISKDNIESHKKFISKFKIPFQLLSDAKMIALKKYGAWGEKSMYGKKFMGIKRTTVLINPKGKIIKIWNNVKVKDHAAEVLNAVKEII
ncbi:MAG: peroxiredoxin [Proteobacteria bacterium]|uniref:thioredoxin-dependent peroxiredoxin n=2 Tax=Candidatus Fonsibacter lacus TaxID=2576439 RepID=A0A966HTZ4_9PROT|nr:peroxiredoxin [Candidatus Fonsibacter lacus]NCU53007.1 peroxiredoxin [Candidatus Fonsibacter lacus]